MRPSVVAPFVNEHGPGGEPMEAVRPKTEDEQYSRDLADRWFQTLDHRLIAVGKRRWIARVTGIHLDGREAWIQIAAGRSPDKSLVLHLSGWTTIDQVMSAMKSRPVEGGPYPRIVSVIPTA